MKLTELLTSSITESLDYDKDPEGLIYMKGNRHCISNVNLRQLINDSSLPQYECNRIRQVLVDMYKKGIGDIHVKMIHDICDDAGFPQCTDEVTDLSGLARFSKVNESYGGRQNAIEAFRNAQIRISRSTDFFDLNDKRRMEFNIECVINYLKKDDIRGFDAYFNDVLSGDKGDTWVSILDDVFTELEIEDREELSRIIK